MCYATEQVVSIASIPSLPLYMLSTSSLLTLGFSFLAHEPKRKSCHYHLSLTLQTASSRIAAGRNHDSSFFCRSCSPVLALSKDNSGFEAAQKYDYDEIEALILSPPSPSEPKGRSSLNGALTSLELEALAVKGSANISLRERTEVVNGLLNLLQQKGVPQGYAFEFVRHGRELIKNLIIEARQNVGVGSKRSSSWQQDDSEPEKQNISVSENTLQQLDEDTTAATNTKEFTNSSLASRVCICAEQQGLPRFVSYFQQLNMKAYDIAKVLPYVGGRIEFVMAKVEFLRSIGVRSNQLPAVLASWPQLLSHDCDCLVLVTEYLKGLGFTHKEIGTLVVRFPQILGRDVELELRPTAELLEDFGVSVKEVKKLIFRHPVLLTEKPEEKLKALVSYLESIGVKRKHIGPLLNRRPMLLKSNVEKDLWPIGAYLKTIHASADDIDKIITSFPWLFRYDVDQDFRPAVQHLESLGVDPGLMGKLFRRHPQLLKNRLNFELKTNFLLQIGLEHKDLGKVIYNAPQLLGLSIEEKILPTIEFLGSMGIRGPCLIKVLKLKPMLLAHSIDSKLQPNVKFFEELGIKREDIGKLVTRYPQLLTLSVEKNLEPTVTYLVELGFTGTDIANMVRRLPSLLGFNVVTVLEPKYKYLVDNMRRSPKELVQFPQIFSYSLTKRIIARHQLLGETFQSLSLSSIYGCSDLVFERKLQRWQRNDKDSDTKISKCHTFL